MNQHPNFETVGALHFHCKACDKTLLKSRFKQHVQSKTHTEHSRFNFWDNVNLFENEFKGLFSNAVLKCEYELMDFLIKVKKCSINSKIIRLKNTHTVLTYFTAQNNLTGVIFALKYSPNVNAVDNNGATALQWAIYKKNYEMVQVLLIYNTTPWLVQTHTHDGKKCNALEYSRIVFPESTKLLQTHIRNYLAECFKKLPLEVCETVALML